MQPVSISNTEIPRLFDDFVKWMGTDKLWIDRVRVCDNRTSGNEFLRDYLRLENHHAYCLNEMASFFRKPLLRAAPGLLPRAWYPTTAFLAQLKGLRRSISTAEADALRQRVRGAFRNPIEFRSLGYEMETKLYLEKAGCAVEWLDPNKGLGTHDLMVSTPKLSKVAVECKSFDSETARKLKQEHVCEFLGALSRELQGIPCERAEGKYVVITLPSGIPVGNEENKKFVRDIAAALVMAADTILDDGTVVAWGNPDYGEFSGLLDTSTYIELQEAANALTGLLDPIYVLPRIRGRAFLICIQSQSDSSFVETVFKALKRKAKQQLPKDLPGVLFVELEGVRGDQLIEIAAQRSDFAGDGNVLRDYAEQFFKASHRAHVAGVVFHSRPTTRPLHERGSITGTRSGYVLVSNVCPFITDELAELLRFGDERVNLD